MKPRTIALLLALAAPLSARNDVKKYRDAYRNPSGVTAIVFDNYIQGIGAGLMWANVELESVSRQPLFCQPNGIALNTENYKDLLNAQIKKEEAHFIEAKVEAYDIEMLLVRALIDAFPCKAAAPQKTSGK